MSSGIPFRWFILALIAAVAWPASLLAEGGDPLWQVGEPLPLANPTLGDDKAEAYPSPSPTSLSSTQVGELAEGQLQISKAREQYAQACAENPEDSSLREKYAWFLYSNGYHDRDCLLLLETTLQSEKCSDPVRFFNAITEVRSELKLPATTLPKPKPPATPVRSGKRMGTNIPGKQAGVSKNTVTPERTDRFRHWMFTPYYDYSFFNKGRQGWQEEYAQLVYRANERFLMGAEVDVLERPPSGTNVYYSALASYYFWKWLETHAKVSICPSPTFAATQIYSGGVICQALPRLGVLLDYQRYNFIQGPIDQINPGLAYNFTDDTALVLRYVRGWAFYDLDYNYYSAALNLGLPGKRKLTLAFAYGTDPDSEIGANGSSVTSLSPAYTYSAFLNQPITRDISLFTGVQYIYRLKESGGQLYQQLTPTVGCSLSF